MALVDVGVILRRRLGAQRRGDAAPGRVALVLGSGGLLDVPLEELSRRFGEVWLVDMVHPWRARLWARRLGNVRLIEHDITERLEAGRDAPVPPRESFRAWWTRTRS